MLLALNLLNLVFSDQGALRRWRFQGQAMCLKRRYGSDDFLPRGGSSHIFNVQFLAKT